MKEPGDPDWDPMSDWVLEDQVAAYDEMRRRCPVAYSEALGWSLFRPRGRVAGARGSRPARSVPGERLGCAVREAPLTMSGNEEPR